MSEGSVRPTYLVTDSVDPVHNLALEASLLERVPSGEVTLFLWQNQHTVVIGRNQDVCRETKESLLTSEGGHLVRRLSGGGAVYHDLGNLNFTFIARDEDYDVDRHLQVILDELASFGLAGEKSGRNDLEIDGAKFSGNAFYSQAGQRYHHGTLLVDVDMENLGRYLVPSPRKLKAKGVDSVRSRVTNLSALEPGITIESLTQALITSFGRIYGAEPVKLTEADIDSDRHAELKKKFGSTNWIFGDHLSGAYVLGDRFSWGEVNVSFRIREGIITRALVDSDAMDIEGIKLLADALTDTGFSPDELVTRLEGARPENPEHARMFDDIIRLIHDEADAWPEDSRTS